MRRITLLIVLAFSGPVSASSVTFEAGDGIIVHAEQFLTGDRDAPLVLLFHQGGGDGRGEYAEIAARLNTLGFNALAVDLRVGGDRFGGVNRTLKNLPDDVDYGYCDAYPDLEAALDFALDDGHMGPIVAWGSSYSAALVFQLAARRAGDIDAILAFSPASGGPLADCRPDLFVADVDVPVLVLRPSSEFELDSVKQQMSAFESRGFLTHVADPGVHGSSMLVADRAGGDTETTWRVVLDFLARVAPPAN